jgi:Transcriptional Coactivator p15 (PC4)
MRTSADPARTDFVRAGSADTWRQVAEAAPALAEPIVVVQFWKNRRGEAVRLILNRYEGRDVVDLRTWYTADGKLKPGKGFAAEVRHLSRLAAAFNKAVTKARELGLISDEGGGR